MNDLARASERLIEILEKQQPLMRDLIKAMRAERGSFVSARPSVLERVGSELLPMADRIAKLETERKVIADEIQTILHLEDELSVSLLAPNLAGALADQLTATAAKSAELAKTLRVEQAVGNQLLNFSRQAQEGMYRNLIGLHDENMPGYDKNARTLTNSPGGGQLLSGLI